MTMTNRQFFETIAATQELSDELRNFAEEAIVKLDRKNAQRRSSESKTAKANKPLKAEIVALLQENGGQYLTSEIAEHFEYSSQKASALLRDLVKDGILQVEDVRVKGRGTQKAYSLLQKTE